MNAHRTVLAVAVATAALAACSRDAGTRHAPLPPDEATELLHQRIWLDQEPRKESDSFHVLVFDGGQHMGVFQNRTIWKGNFEGFLYEAQSGRLDLRLPASHKRLQTGFSIEKAKRGRADVKLTLQKSPNGPTVYYGYRFDGDADAFAKTFVTDPSTRP